MNWKNIIALSACSLVAACASSIPISFSSSPEGAALVCGGEVIGQFPRTLWRTQKELEEFRSLKFENCTAQWPSGAIANIYVRDEPNGLSYSAARPADAPGLEQDMANANQARLQQSQPQQVQQQAPANQPSPVYQPTPLPTMPSVSFPSAPGRTTTICRTLSNGTVVCD